VSVNRCHVASNTRAGIAVFGGVLELGNSVVWCNDIALDGEQNAGESFQFFDLGGNHCGCDDVETTCKIASSGLAPPDSLGP
jgi:hypothetical protein